MKTKSTSSDAFFNPRVLVGFALCSVALLLALAGLSKSATGTVVTIPASTRWYVNGVTGNDSNDCMSPTTACKTIGHAISLAAAGDLIKAAAATYPENLTIETNLKIIGVGATTTIIDGGGVGSVVRILHGHVTLSKLTLQHGHSDGGGGINNSGTLAVNDCILSGNSGGPFFGGGAIFNNHGIVTINRSTLSDNSVLGGRILTVGGGIYNSGTLTINNSTLSGNAANFPVTEFVSAYGGGIYNSGTLTINNSTLSGNRAYSDNESALGGGIWSSGTLTINNSTLSGNSTYSSGESLGGNIYVYGGTSIFQNSIVADSPFGGNCSGTLTSNGYNLSSDSTCNFHNTGDLNNIEPLLGPLQDNGGPTQTMAELEGSPAIDAGNPGGCTDGQGRLLRTDQRGMPRPNPEDTGGCDMGAYESQSD